jgi:hypothetical protein
VRPLPGSTAPHAPTVPKTPYVMVPQIEQSAATCTLATDYAGPCSMVRRVSHVPHSTSAPCRSIENSAPPLPGSTAPHAPTVPTNTNATVPTFESVRPLPGSTAPHAPTVPTNTNATVPTFESVRPLPGSMVTHAPTVLHSRAMEALA